MDPPPNSDPAPPRSRQSPTRPARGVLDLPVLQRPDISLNFGRLNSDYTIVTRTLQIDALEALPRAVFHTLESLVTIDLAITEDQFIQVFKTLAYKRVQDVITMQTGTRPANYIRFLRALRLPAPIADFYDALGTFTSARLGMIFHLAAPEVPKTNRPAWMTLDQNLLSLFDRTVSRFKELYTLKPFPDTNDVAKRALALTSLHAADDIGSVKAYTDETSPEDTVIRLLSEELFDANARFTYDNSHYYCTRNMPIISTRIDYTTSYNLSCNS